MIVADTNIISYLFLLAVYSDTLVLTLAYDSSGCSAYDCEFVALAKQLNVKLVTEDKKYCANFPRLRFRWITLKKRRCEFIRTILIT